MDVIHFPAPKTLSSPLFKSFSPSLSGHTTLRLIIKCRNRAPCFIASATPEMINNPYLVTIYHVSARQAREAVMKSPITTWLEHSPTTALLGQASILPLAQLQVLSLRPWRPPAPSLPWKHQSKGLLPQADWSRQELEMRKQGWGRKVNEKKTSTLGYF